MQTTSLPIQLNTNAPAPNERNGASANGDGAHFGALLSNEMALRQPAFVPAPAPAPVPAPAPKTDAPKPQAARPSQPDDAAPQPAAPQQSAPAAAQPKPAAEQSADADKDGEDKDGAEDSAGDGKAAGSADPASAMLALMASLQQPARDAKAGAAGSAVAQAFDALNGAGGKGKRGDAAQLVALQAAMKSVSKDSAGIATTAGKAVSDAASLRNPALTVLGASLAADDQTAPATGIEAGAKLGADLRATLAAGNSAIGKSELQLNAAELSLQQARDSAVREPVVTAAALAQPSVMEVPQAAAAAAGGLSARVGSEAWEKQVGQKVVYMVGSEEQTASLTLNPPDLGPLQVVLSVTNDQASVTFSADQEEVRYALENALPRLREMMSASGIALGYATVNAGMPDGHQAQQQASRNSGGFGGNGRGRGDGSKVFNEPAVRPVARTALLGDRGMVDTFA